MKSGEHIDLTNNLGKDILASMAVMYRPITRKFKDVYDIEKYNGTNNKEIFKNTPISVYLGAQVFFWNLTNDLLKLIPQYLEKELTAEQLADLERNGVGLPSLNNKIGARACLTCVRLFFMCEYPLKDTTTQPLKLYPLGINTYEKH